MAQVTFVSRMTVQEGREPEFIGLCRNLEQYVAASEGGVVFFRFYRLREPRRYVVFESFADEAAEHAHMNSAKLAEVAPKIAACLIGTWEREYFDPL